MRRRPPYQQQIQVLSALLGRQQLLSRLYGKQYSDHRDIYQALGYPHQITYDMYAAKYERHDIAKAVINRPVQATWSGDIYVVETNDENVTDFERAWKELWDRLQLKSKFVRLDKLSSMGKYGVLVLGLDDVSSTDAWRNPVRKGKRTLKYVRPLSQGNAKIGQYVNDTTNERYGQPEFYDVTLSNPDGSGSGTVRIHYSRVIHVVGELLESEVDGVPVLQAVYNRLMDLEKLVGASAEMFWRGARPGFQGKIDKDFTLTQEVKDSLKEMWDEYEHDLRRIMMAEGVEFQQFETQLADPRWHVDVQLQMISAVTGIPKRILVGSERGELASSEDRNSWHELIQTRQKDLVEAQIMRPFISTCQKYQILPPSENYHVIWPDLFAPSDKDKASIGQMRAAALQSYLNNPAAAFLIPRQVFVEYCWGLSENDIDYVLSLLESNKEEDALKIIQEMGKKSPPTKTGQGAAEGAGSGNGQNPSVTVHEGEIQL